VKNLSDFCKLSECSQEPATALYPVSQELIIYSDLISLTYVDFSLFSYILSDPSPFCTSVCKYIRRFFKFLLSLRVLESNFVGLFPEPSISRLLCTYEACFILPDVVILIIFRESTQFKARCCVNLSSLLLLPPTQF